MSNESSPGLSSSPKVLGIAGLSLFLLGIAASALVWMRRDASADTVQLVLAAAVLLSLGCMTLAITGVKRLEERVRELEQKLREK